MAWIEVYSGQRSLAFKPTHEILYYANCDDWNTSKHNGKCLKNNRSKPEDMVRLKKKNQFGGNKKQLN